MGHLSHSDARQQWKRALPRKLWSIEDIVALLELTLQLNNETARGVGGWGFCYPFPLYYYHWPDFRLH
jgi:hypothetical protein